MLSIAQRGHVKDLLTKGILTSSGMCYALGFQDTQENREQIQEYLDMYLNEADFRRKMVSAKVTFENVAKAEAVIEKERQAALKRVKDVAAMSDEAISKELGLWVEPEPEPKHEPKPVKKKGP